MREHSQIFSLLEEGPPPVFLCFFFAIIKEFLSGGLVLQTSSLSSDVRIPKALERVAHCPFLYFPSTFRALLLPISICSRPEELLM